MKKILVALVIGTFVFGCGAKKEAAEPVAAANAPGTAAQAQQPANGVPAVDTTQPVTASTPAAAQPPTVVASKLTGTVLETMDASGYTYMKLKTASGEQWAATPQTKVKKGQSVTLMAQMTADKFESSTLHRTFDKIVFATIGDGNVAPAAQTAAPSAMPPGHPAMPAGMGGMSAMGSPADHMKPKVDVGDLKVDRAEGANAKTVAELWADRASLNGKPVVVRGKVVKFLGGIMGTNFMHLRDGSGSEAKGDHDLTVTTSEGASVGDVVTISGTVHVDKDFGAGYRYPVIVEGASVKK
jgi:hypothetical protein